MARLRPPHAENTSKPIRHVLQKCAVFHAGLSTARSAVPSSERTPAAWFKSPQLLTSDLPPLPLPAPPAVAAAWAASVARYQQALACVQALRKSVQEGRHADIGSREAAMMAHVTEHVLLHLRRQHSALESVGRVAPPLARLRRALRETLPHNSPATEADHAYSRAEGLLESVPTGARHAALVATLAAQQRTMPLLLDGLHSAQEMCPPACALESPTLRAAFAHSAGELASVHSTLSVAWHAVQAAVGEAPQRRAGTPLLFATELRRAMAQLARQLADAKAAVDACGARVVSDLDQPLIEGPLTVARLHPAWKRLTGALDRAVQDCGTPEGGEQDSAPHSEATVTQLAAPLEATLRHILLWSQGTSGSGNDSNQHAAGRAAPSGSDRDAADVAACSSALTALLQAPALMRTADNLTAAAAALVATGSTTADSIALHSAAAGTEADSAECGATGICAKSHQLAAALSMVDILLAGVWAAAQHTVLLHAACSQLAVRSR